MRFGIVVSAWNNQVTEALYEGARDTLLAAGVANHDIVRIDVPGSFELPLAALRLAKGQHTDGIICLGCIVKGETPHNEFIAQAVANGIMRLNLDLDLPVVFGVLTPNTQEQALARAGGNMGNKGSEAAATALLMARR